MNLAILPSYPTIFKTLSKKEPAAVTSARITSRGVIIVAVIGLLSALIVGYWQFVWLPEQGARQDTTAHVGRVVDNNGQRPVVGAKITLSMGGVPQITYTDSEGVYSLLVTAGASVTGRITVEAQGYEVYTRNITISPDGDDIVDIRLVPQASILPSDTPALTPTANATLQVLFSQAATPDTGFIPRLRQRDEVVQIWVPGGTFVAGDVSGVGYDDEKPLHVVYTDSFWMDRTTATNSDYARCPESLCSAPHKLDSHVRPNGYYGVPAYADYPVMNVTWQQASDYCGWRGGRLPTEAEFEKAAGWDPTTGLTFIYPWGNQPPSDVLANFDGIDRDTRPVGSYSEGMSPTGAHDMAGNIWQWVSDWYSETYYADNDDWVNPAGPPDGNFKVIRGASWFSSETRWLRVSNRGMNAPDKYANEVGFRCVFED